MKNGKRMVTMGSLALLGSALVSSWPALAAEEVVHKTQFWLTQCTVDEKTRERNCSIWRSLASPELDSGTPKKLVFVINAVDDHAFVQAAPYAPVSLAVDTNPAVPLKDCLAPTFCMLETGRAAELRRQLQDGADLVLTVRGEDGDARQVKYDLAGYPAAASAAKQWLSQP